MNIKKIKVMYFSPTGNVKRIASCLGAELSLHLDVPVESIDFTLPKAREDVYHICSEELLVIGTPVYASRVPNKILSFIKENVKGDKTPCIAFVSYGNRSFGDALSELVYETGNNGFICAGGAAIVSEHAFSDELAAGRPDYQDIEEIKAFAGKVAAKIKSFENVEIQRKVDGQMPPGPYYTPLKEDGTPAVFLKAKPITDMNKCTGCGACARKCPMGSIDISDTSKVPGICIKCHACVHVCTKGAKSFEDPELLSHIRMIVNNYKEHKNSAFYL